MALATAVTGNVVTISPPLHMPNWRSAQSPQVWIIQPIIRSGIEDLSMTSNGTGSSTVLIWSGLQCWVKGTRSINPDKSHVEIFESLRTVIRDNYFYGAINSDPYGIYGAIDGSSLVENNIIQQVRSSIVLNGASSGSVFGYNFTTNNDNGGSFMWFSHWNHSAGIAMNLSEGNVGNGYANDDIHGTHNFITRFRNYYTGWESGASEQTNAIFEASYVRYGNIIGNVLGTTGHHTAYQNTSGAGATIYILGYGNCCTTPPVPSDPTVASTLMRWGNWDVVTSTNTSSTNDLTGIRWANTEVPSGISPYANAIPSNHALPASFYLSATPNWWPSAKAWPPIGPDVTGGSITHTGGHANTIPAQDCFLNVMGGPADGSGGPLSFNAGMCYASAPGSVNPPSALTGVVH
jgi:hypothetical protein